MDFNMGLSIAGIGSGTVVTLLAMKPMKPVVRWALFSLGMVLIMAGVWGMLSGRVVGGEPENRKPSVSIEQTKPYNSPPIVGDRNTVTINPEVNPNAPVATYDFNGAKRVTSPGRFSVEAGVQMEAFKKIIELRKSEDWISLRDLCEQEIKNTPEWLTPSLYVGLAYMNLGQVDKAIERLDYVRQKAGGNSAYADADKMREAIRQQYGK
jgi:hypothetical protein